MDAVVDGKGDVFDVAGRLGFDGVELSLSREDLRSGDPGTVELRRRDTTLEIHAFVLGEHNFGEVADANADVAAAAAEDVRTAVDWAGRLGVELVPLLHARPTARRGRLRPLHHRLRPRPARPSVG